MIPGRLEKETAEWLRHARESNPGLVEIGQHGYMHRLYDGVYEFGPSRTYAMQLSDINKGKCIMENMLGEISGIFSPPTDFADANTTKALNEAGFRAISISRSAYLPKSIIKVIRMSMDINMMDEATGDWYVSESEILLKRLRLLSSFYKRVGITVHHDKLRDSDFARIARFLSSLKAHKGRFVRMSSIID